jgi:hypothetical protein
VAASRSVRPSELDPLTLLGRAAIVGGAAVRAMIMGGRVRWPGSLPLSRTSSRRLRDVPDIYWAPTKK